MHPWSLARARAPFAALVLAVLALVTCSSDEAPLKAVSEDCLINSDCATQLVCAFRRCHTQCKISHDCDLGQRCVVSDRPYHVCQLDKEKLCTYTARARMDRLAESTGSVATCAEPTATA